MFNSASMTYASSDEVSAEIFLYREAAVSVDGIFANRQSVKYGIVSVGTLKNRREKSAKMFDVFSVFYYFFRVSCNFFSLCTIWDISQLHGHAT